MRELRQCETNFWPIAVNIKEQTNQVKNLTDLSWSWKSGWVDVWDSGASQVWPRIKNIEGGDLVILDQDEDLVNLATSIIPVSSIWN